MQREIYLLLFLLVFCIILCLFLVVASFLIAHAHNLQDSMSVPLPCFSLSAFPCHFTHLFRTLSPFTPLVSLQV